MTFEQEKLLLEYLSQPRHFFSIFCRKIKEKLGFEFKDGTIAQFEQEKDKLLPFQKLNSKTVYNEKTQKEVLDFVEKVSHYNEYLKEKYKNNSTRYPQILDEVVVVKKIIEMIGISKEKNFVEHIKQDNLQKLFSGEYTKLKTQIKAEEEKVAQIKEFDLHSDEDLQKEKHNSILFLINQPDQFYNYLLKLPEELKKQHWKQSAIDQIKKKIEELAFILGPKDNNNETIAFSESVKGQVLNSLMELENFLTINYLEPYSDDIEIAKKEHRKALNLSDDAKIVPFRIKQLTNSINLAKDFISSINIKKENNEANEFTFSDIVKNRKDKVVKANKDFVDIEKMTKQQDEIMENIHNYASISSAFSRNEQNSMDVKKAILDICEEYEALTLNDKEFSKILSLVRSYGNMDATASNLYEEEVNAIEKIQLALTSYMEKIDKDNQKLLDEQDAAYKKILKIKNEDERKEKLKELNDRFDKQDADLDTKRHLALSISNYFENMGRGDLVCPDFENIEEAKVKPGYSCELKDPEKSYYINGAGIDVNLKQTWIDYSELYDDDGKFKEDYFYKKQKELSNQKTETEYYKDLPLFPHEPRPNDISQGALGDCYLLSGLSGVAAFRPQDIKDMIKDNGDGTATVRFYKQVKEDGELVDIPVYVRVDKAIGYKNGSFRGASNCLWASIIERAYAISGLHLNRFVSSNDEELNYKLDYADKEKLDKEYEKIKQEFDTKKDEKEQQDFLKVVSEQYPWLVCVKEIVKDHNLQYTYELQKWSPSMEDIESGRTHMAMQTCFGLKYRAKEIGTAKESAGLNSYEIKKTLYRGGMVYASTDNDKTAGIDNHAFTIIGWYEKPGNPPITMIRLRNPWGTSNKNAFEFDDEDKVTLVHRDEGIFDITSEQFAKHFQRIYINTSEELENTPYLKQSFYNDDVQNAPNQNDGILTQDAYVEYLRFARDIHEAIVKTDSWYVKNPTQFKELLKESITFRECVAKSRNLGIESLNEAYSKLKLKADAYVNSLNINNMSKSQKSRYDVCQTINDLGKQLQAKTKQPRQEIQKQFLKQLIAKTYQEKKTKIEQEQLEPLASKLLNKKVVRTALEKVNIHELKQAKDTLLNSVMDDIKKIGKGIDKEAGFNFEETIKPDEPVVNMH